ncbi:2-keto-4-pentenoate hydratase [Lysinibacillus fusiformis]|nr:2-keto-4-pentenoate hydratase [Lysinibacillus fusiformis]
MDTQLYAEKLQEAEETKRPIEPLTSTVPEISVDDAYAIQLHQIARKQQKGKKIVGKKIGLTSKAMQQQFNVTEPDYGHILSDMVEVDGATISLNHFIEPKLEFEIAFVLKKDLFGPNITVEDVIEATDYIVPALEVIDSRIAGWKIRFEDTVADNGSSAMVIIGGTPTKLSHVNLPHIGMNVYRNGELFDSAAAAAVMGNPLHAVAWLANKLSKYDIGLQADEFVLAGALTAAVTIEDGDTFTADFAHLGAVSATFRQEEK